MFYRSHGEKPANTEDESEYQRLFLVFRASFLHVSCIKSFLSHTVSIGLIIEFSSVAMKSLSSSDKAVDETSPERDKATFPGVPPETHVKGRWERS